MNRTKNKIFALALIAICLALLGYGTYAYYTDSTTTHNIIRSGKVAITLDEWADEEETIPFPEDTVEGVMPGEDVTKIVEITNQKDSADAWVRILVEKEIILAEGIDEEADLDMIVLDINEDKWELRDDGYYYYKEVLMTGETTEPLFTTVTFHKKMDNRYQGCTVRISVTAEAVQAANNDSQAGWPEKGA